jgi:peptidyl-prolyl cis-trans isomerase D
MAVIIKIRNRFGLLISILIFVALGIFVLETALNSNSNLLKGHSNTIGSVDGEDISYQDFNAELDKEITSYKLQNPKANVDDQTTFSLRDQAWNTIVNNTINQKEYDAVGVTLSDAEYKDMFQGVDPNPLVKQQFTNPQTGLFDPQYVAYFIRNLDNDKTGETRAKWENFEEYVVQNQLQKKYQDLLKKAVYVPKWQAQLTYNDRTNRVSFQYVDVPYISIPDAAVKVTDLELQSYIDANKAKYRQDEETRKIQFVTFNVIPSSDDTAAALKYINNTYSKLEDSPNDTDFMKENADNPNDPVYYTKDKIISAEMKDTLFKVSVGSLLGPFFEDDSYKIIKLVDRKSVSDSVKVKDILFSVAEDGSDSSKVYKKADSVLQLVRSKGANFDSLAANFSDDKDAGKKGGDIGWLKQGFTLKPLNNYLFFDSKPGDIKLMKLTEQNGRFGYHIIKNVEASPVNPAVKLVYITRKLEPSNTTDKSIFNAASNFALKNNTESLFKASADAQKLHIYESDNLKQNDFYVPDLGVNRDIIKWTYAAKAGEISPVISSDNKYVVAVLDLVTPKGIQQLNSIRATVAFEVKKQKKAELLAANLIVPCELNATLESFASYTGQSVKKAQNVTLGSQYIPGIGVDAKLQGAIFGLKQGELSYPIAGDNSVYIVKIDSIETSKPIADYSMIQQQLAAQQAGSVDYGLTEAIKKTMKVEDYRYNFF